jgi:hypothetical protein
LGGQVTVTMEPLQFFWREVNENDETITIFIWSVTGTI